MLTLGLTALCGGILAGTFWEAISLFAAGAVFSILVAVFSQRWRVGAAVILIAFSLGLLRIGVEPRGPEASDIGLIAKPRATAELATVTGRVSALPDRRFDHDKWLLAVETAAIGDTAAQPLTGKLLITLPRGTELGVGDTITVTGRLEEPFVSEEFSYRDFLAKDHIYALMAFPRFERGARAGAGWRQTLSLWRASFDRRLKAVIPPPESGFAAGILVGDKSGLSDAWQNDFQTAGLSHLLALSGFNITIIVLAVFWLLAFLPKAARLLITMLAVSLFVAFVGGGASIVRAAIMGLCGLVVIETGRQASAITLLMFASAVMGLFSPLIFAYDPSFQLSFAGVAGMIGLQQPLQSFFRKYSGRRLAELLSATLAAQCGVLPLILMLFGEVSLIAPIANLVVAPLIPWAMLSAFLAVIFSFFLSPLGHFLGFISWNILHLGLTSIQLFAKIPGASISAQISFEEGALLALFITIAALYAKLRQART